jgi:hypothetical protein
MRNLEPRRVSWMRVRVALLALLLTSGAGAVAYRGFGLMVQRAPALREMAEAQYLRDVRLSPKRGTIYDRNGAELAVSVDVDSVWANPRELRAGGMAPQAVADGLSRPARGGPRRCSTQSRRGSSRWSRRAHGLRCRPSEQILHGRRGYVLFHGRHRRRCLHADGAAQLHVGAGQRLRRPTRRHSGCRLCLRTG